MKKTYLISCLALCLALLYSGQSLAGTPDGRLQLKARLGYSIGATAPTSVPATIRSIDAFRLTPSLMVGADLQINLHDKWGLLTGLHVENKGMDTEVTTKGYRMEVVKGDSKIEGLFTGHVKQEVTQWMFTLPVMCTFDVSDKVTLKAGPYFSLLLSNDFSGIASDGYLRQGDPTGPRINMGNKKGEWATYDFSDDMRSFQTGIAVGADWQVHQHFGLSADYSWGLNGIFHSDFKTVEQTLYPIYLTIGAFWKF